MIEFIDNTGMVTTFRNSGDFANFTQKAHELGKKLIKEAGLGIYAKEKK
jgi:hypothetical protein